MYIIFLLLIFTSCKSQFVSNKDLKFISKTDESVSTITLLKDGKFEYHNKEKLATQYSSGIWFKTENKIHLISYTIYKTGIVDSRETIYLKKSNTKITLIDTLDNFVIGAGITVNNNPNQGWNTNEYGYVKFQKKKIRSITIYYLGQKYFYMVQNPNSNIFKLTIHVDDLSTKYFDNEIWTLKNNYLISPMNKLYELKHSK